jgi:M6 family metalloprotease-like protein
MRYDNRLQRFGLIALVVLLVAATVSASPPTEEAIELWRESGQLEKKLATLKKFDERIAQEAAEMKVRPWAKSAAGSLATATQADTAYVVVVLVDFNDNPYTNNVAGTPAAFDSILFSNRETDSIFNPTGSMTDYFLENSYGQFYIKGDIFGWYRMPKTYAYYVGDDDGLTNGRELARDAAIAAHNAGVDFSKYDLLGDGECDGLIIIHAGQGAETGAYGIWSHKSTIWPPLYYDGVKVSVYNMNPEERGSVLAPIGVVCHEYGHTLGLPDLYDIDYEPASSDGLGKWSIMAAGAHLGSGRQPSHFDAWCKVQLGFVDPIVVTENIHQAEIPAVEYNPVIYKLHNSASGSREYWLVENRQKKEFDYRLPGHGLCVYHVDLDAPDNNTNHLRYRVALEQADGRNDLALTVGNDGDASDPFPAGGTAREFHSYTSPDSRTNAGILTNIAVWNITDSDSVMYADLDVGFSRPFILAHNGDDSFVFDDTSPNGDGDGRLEAGETISFTGTFANWMRAGYNPTLTLTSASGAPQFLANDVPLSGDLAGNPQSNSLNPIVFTLPDTLRPIIDSFYVTLTVDSLPGVAYQSNGSQTFGLEVVLGNPRILVVDDDRGADYEQVYATGLHKKRMPWDVWTVEQMGAPGVADLDRYEIVFWMTGNYGDTVINQQKMDAMRGYLDNGGNLVLSTASGIIEMQDIDSSFVSNYLRARHVGEAFHPHVYGVDDNPVGDGFKYFYRKMEVPVTGEAIQPINGAQAAFYYEPGEICGLTYSGEYRLIFLSFAPEYIAERFDPFDTLMTRMLEFFGPIPTDVYDGTSFAAVPRTFSLQQNYPNPFNPSTTIGYTISASGGFGQAVQNTRLTVLNMLGQRVKVLVDAPQGAGTYEVMWDGTNEVGSSVASGVYFYQLERGDKAEARKMVLVK